MQVVFIKLLTILMTLPGFGVEANPNAPTSAEVLKYAPAQADVMAYIDFGAFLPNNYRAMMSLDADPRVKSDKATLEIVRDLKQKVALGESMVKSMAGLDLSTDLQWGAMWLSIPDAGDPDVLVVVHGTFPADILDKAGAALGGSVSASGSGKILVGPSGESFGLAADGTIILGTTKLVKERLSPKWKPSTKFQRLPALLDDKPFALVASSPTKRALRRIARELDDDDDAFARDFMQNHRFASLSLRHDGLDWTWVDRTNSGFNRAAMASEGLIEIFRAGHNAVRGFSKLAMVVMSSYADKNPELAMVSGNEKLILDAIDAITGDGSFTARVDRNAKTRTVSVTARGKELAQVLPVAGVLPLAGGAAAAFLMIGSKSSSSAPLKALPPSHAPIRKPASKKSR